MPAHRELFRHRWKGILPHFGLSLKLLGGKHGPCPFCGGKDRFRFSDYRGYGDWICNQCGAGEGIEFVKRALGVDFKEAIWHIERVAVNIEETKPVLKSGKDHNRMLNSIWMAARPPTRGCPVWMYLENRVGPLRAISGCLRHHPELSYTHENGTKTFHPAMIALVIDAEGKACNIHRTYLTSDGRKADVPEPKKTCWGILPKGYAIRLTPVSESMGIAEGIETALAATALTGTPCWAAVNSHGLETWEVPQGVKRVTIFGDHDPHYIGQATAYNLARRLILKSIAVEVAIPYEPGDWCNVLSNLEGKDAA